MHRAIRVISFAVVMLAGARLVEAQILKCKDSENRVVYTQGMCPPGTSPAEPDESVSRVAPGSRSGGGFKSLSPAAKVVKDQHDQCYSGEKEGPGCQTYRDLVRLCKQPASSVSADCRALHEYKAAVTHEGDKLLADLGQANARSCADGDQRYCPPPRFRCGDASSLVFEGTDAEVRECARQLSLPSTSSWAQVSQKTTVQHHLGDAKQWSGEYVCLRFIGFPTATGERLRMRPSMLVSQAVKVGTVVPGFEVNDLGKVFPTKVAAVEAGCEAAYAEAKSLEGR